MFTASEHLQGWLAYGVGATLGLICWWYLLSKLPLKPLKPVLLGVMVGLLGMPWTTDVGSEFYAPAWLIAGSDGLFEAPEAFWRAGTPLLMAMGVAAVIALIIQIVWSLKAGAKPSASETAKRARERSDKTRVHANPA